jgi:membrane protease YdiL (CAAX protease family)
VPEGGLVGLGIAVALFVALAIVEAVAKYKRAGRNDAKARQRLEGNELLPRNRQELILFLGFGLLAGCGWELLYRGFLIWFLVPRIGMVGATCVAALAYGAAHGYKTRGQFAGSMISAFAFTIAFVLSGSLWWLMLIHTMVALVGGINSYKLFSKGSGDVAVAGAGASGS